jgi:NOL1/NOP2/fmu family ribosome biogenesis protein
LQKRAATGEENNVSGREKNSRQIGEKIPKEKEQFIAWLVDDPASFFFFRHKEDIRAVPQQEKDAVEKLYRLLNVRYGGLTLGAIKGKDFIPAHALALSVHNALYYPTAELERKEALLYLKRELNTLPVEIPNGWASVTYKNVPLGWIKNLGNRINNYYPPEWRIRMNIDV